MEMDMVPADARVSHVDDSAPLGKIRDRRTYTVRAWDEFEEDHQETEYLVEWDDGTSGWFTTRDIYLV